MSFTYMVYTHIWSSGSGSSNSSSRSELIFLPVILLVDLWEVYNNSMSLNNLTLNSVPHYVTGDCEMLNDCDDVAI